MNCQLIIDTYYAWLWKDNKFYTGKGNTHIQAIRNALMQFQNRLIIKPK